MKTYFSDIIPKIQRFSQKLDNITLLTNQHWVFIDDIERTKNVYIFRQNGVLLISQNGKVEKANWEYLGNRSLLIDRKDESYLFKHGFFDENILALKIDSKDEYALFVNESKYDKELNSFLGVVEFLEKKYIEPTNPKSKRNKTEVLVKSTTESGSENLTIYYAPKYEITKTIKTSTLWGKTIIKYSIVYDDGINDEIVFNQKNNQTYFIVEKDFTRHRYKNLDSCIDALHYFKKTGKILKHNYIQQKLF